MLDLKSLNQAQKKAVTHKDGPLLIVAGAGTGKTTVITKRVAWLIDQGLAKPDEILCLTFTDKAAGEMEERIDKLLPYGYVDLWVMTFHAFAERVLKQHGIEIGIPADFKLLDQTSQWMMIHDNFDKFDLDYYRPMGNPTKFISAMLSHFSRAKDEGVTPSKYLDYVQDLSLDADSADFLQFGDQITSKSKKKNEDDLSVEELWTQEIARRKELASAYHTYQQILLENNALDFGDLIVYLKQLLEERPLILQTFRKKFKYVLVDEFQDTNWAQYELVKMLAQPNNNITVVGDDDQSVYKFRGASISNILGFKSDFPKSEQVVLTTNYRSAQSILDLAYNFIQHNNPHRLEFQLNEDSDTKKEADQKNIDLSGFKAINKKLKAFKKTKGEIDHLHYKSVNDEAAGVLSKIIAIKNKDSKIKWSDFAILVRANSSAEPFLQQLILAEVPYQFMASKGLFAKPAVLDTLSYLKLLDDYAESTAMYRILILPTVDLSNEDLMSLLHHSKRESMSLRESMKIASIVGVSLEGVNKCTEVLEKLDKHATMARTKRVSEVAMAFIDDYKLKQYFEKLEPLIQRDVYMLLNHFWKKMQKFEEGSDEKSVKKFLAYINLTKEAGDSGSLPQDIEEGPDTIKVMTIHGSKGLEFKYVFVVSMVDRRFPTTERKESLPLPEALINEITPGENQHLEEERRLCYVAITRAKEAIFLTSADDYGGARKKKLSRFVSELGFEQKEPITLKSNIAFGEGFTQNFEVAKAKDIDYKKYLPKVFSYSQLKAFQTCPWQYRYAHILKIPVHGNFTISFGVSLHNTLEKFFARIKEQQQSLQSGMFGGQSKEHGKVSIELQELYDIYDEEWIDQWYDSAKHRDESKQKGKKMLKEFFVQHKDNWPEIVEVEQKFTLKVGEHSLRGKIDRVDRLENGSLRLIDYKSNKSKKTYDKDQLLIYQVAAEEVLNEKVDELTYYYLDGLDEKSFIGDEKAKIKIKEKILDTINDIHASDFQAQPAQKKCIYCDYKDICLFSLA